MWVEDALSRVDFKGKSSGSKETGLKPRLKVSPIRGTRRDFPFHGSPPASDDSPNNSEEVPITVRKYHQKCSPEPALPTKS